VIPTGPPAPESPPARRPGGRLVIVAVVTLLVLSLASVLLPTPSTVPSVDYGRFLTLVDQDAVKQVELHQSSGRIDGVRTNGREFRVQGPPGGMPDADLARLDEHHVRRTYVSEDSSSLVSLLLSVLPFVLLIGVIVWMMRGAGRQMTNATAFTRSRARVHRAERPTTTFADVAGYDGVKSEITEIVSFLRDPSAFRAIGARVPKGVLLVGPPGTGKTLIARAVAGQAGVPFISVTGSEFLEMFVGVGAARVRDLFATARKETPSILFIDEIDAIGRKRGTGLGGGHDEREQTLNQLLAEMDGFETTEGIVMLAATNRPDVLDPALLRAGRFDRQVVVPLPTASERLAILRVHARGLRLASDVDLELAARATPGMSGADLANLLNEAALIAVRRQASEITGADVDDARDRVLLGVRRSSLVLNPREKRTVAYHEAGHAVLAELLPGADPVHKVTILPTGMALGATEQVASEEHQLQLKPEIEDAIALRFGGRVAEELVLGVASTGAHDDLVAATELARRMVREWGMSQRLGHVAWGTEGAVFLGESLVHSRDWSEETARLIDEEITRILDEQAARARLELEQHRDLLDAVAEALLEHETLDADQLAEVLSGATPEHRVDPVRAGVAETG
jgi:cell division protease FtsH